VLLRSVVGWCVYSPAGDVLGCPGANPTQQSTKTIPSSANRRPDASSWAVMSRKIRQKDPARNLSLSADRRLRCSARTG